MYAAGRSACQLPLWTPPVPTICLPPTIPRVPAGEPHGFGLEVGSKAELVMVIAQLAGRPHGTNLVCNGYKDSEYMELVGAALSLLRFCLLAWADGA